MKGVKTGDLGPKMGYHSKDNGWCTFDNVRIPRTQLLSKFIDVDRDGSFSIKGDTRELYSVMMLIRTFIMLSTKTFLARALTIAIRYSTVRRQFRNISGQKDETQIIDYQTQQMKLFPILAMNFAHAYFSKYVMDIFHKMMDGINSRPQNYSLMDVMHHLTAGGKSVLTQECNDSLFVVRQSLGGAGYSAWSGIPYLIEDYSPEVTYEGDNTVMAQQSANYLFKQLKRMKKGKKYDSSEFLFYLDQLEETTRTKCAATEPSFFLDLNNLEEALKVHVSVQLRDLMAIMAASKASKKDFTNVLYALDIVKVANAHFLFVIYWVFKRNLQNGSLNCANLRQNMTNLCLLYGLTHL